MDDFYERVDSQDHPKVNAYGAIQWKGTEVCIDLECSCGHQWHYDGWFSRSYFRCPKCGAGYAVGRIVKLIPLTAEDSAQVEDSVGFTVFEDC